MDAEFGIEETVITSHVEGEAGDYSFNKIKVIASDSQIYNPETYSYLNFYDIGNDRYFMSDYGFGRPSDVRLVRPSTTDFHEVVHQFTDIKINHGRPGVFVSDDRKLMMIQIEQSDKFKFFKLQKPELLFEIDFNSLEEFKDEQAENGNQPMPKASITALKLTNSHFYFIRNSNLNRFDLKSKSVEFIAETGIQGYCGMFFLHTGFPANKERESLMVSNPMLRCQFTGNLLLFSRSFKNQKKIIIRRIKENKHTGKAEVIQTENFLIEKRRLEYKCAFHQLASNLLFVEALYSKVFMLHIMSTKTLKLLPHSFNCGIIKGNYFASNPLVVRVRSTDYAIFDIEKIGQVFYFQMAAIRQNKFHPLTVDSKTCFLNYSMTSFVVMGGRAIVGRLYNRNQTKEPRLVRIIFQ